MQKAHTLLAAAVIATLTGTHSARAFQPLVVFNDNFDNRPEGGTVIGTPPVGLFWQKLFGDSNSNYAASSVVNNGGRALQLFRNPTGNSGALRGVMNYSYASVGVMPNTLVTAKIDVNRANSGGAVAMDYGFQIPNSPFFYIHPDGTYRFVDSTGAQQLTGITASDGDWDTLELQATYGSEDGIGQISASFDAYITTPTTARTKVVNGAPFGTCDTGSLFRIIPQNVTPNTTSYWDNALITENIGAEWKVNQNGNWEDNANWLRGVPNGYGVTANFGTFITVSRTVTVNSPTIVAIMNFDSLASYVIDGSQTITIDGHPGQGSAQINVLSGNHTIKTPLVVNRFLNLDVASGSTLSLTGSFSAPDMTITKLSAGTAQLEHMRTDTLVVSAGKLVMRPKSANNSAEGTSLLNALVVVSDDGAVLDLSNNTLAVNYPDASPLPGIRDQLKRGFASGAWTGPGLVSSGAAASGVHKTALAYAEASELGLGNTYNGQPIDETTVIVRYTLSGDATIDGKVTTLDFNMLAGHFGATEASVWREGDFNYDGQIDTLDFNALTSNYGMTLTSESPLGSSLLAAGLVPEPASAALLVCLAGVGRRLGRRSVCRQPAKH